MLSATCPPWHPANAHRNQPHCRSAPGTSPSAEPRSPPLCVPAQSECDLATWLHSPKRVAIQLSRPLARSERPRSIGRSQNTSEEAEGEVCRGSISHLQRIHDPRQTPKSKKERERKRGERKRRNSGAANGLKGRLGSE